MKSILPFLLAICSLSVFAQLSPLEPIHAGHPLFNPSHQPTSVQQTTRGGQMQQLDSTTTKQYDVWSTHWRDWAHTHFAYYTNGTLKQYTTITPQTLKEVVSYNQSGKISEHLFLEYGHFEWDSAQRTQFYYNPQHQAIADTTFVWNNSAWEPHMYTEIRYNSQGYVSKHIYYIKGLAGFEPMNQFVFTTDSNGNIITMENLQYVNNQWEPRNSYHLVYDAQNRRVEFSSDSWDGTAYIPNYKETYQYTHDNLTQLNISFWHNGSWALDTYITYEYNLLEPNSNIYLPGMYMHNYNKLVRQQTHSINSIGGPATVMDSTFFHYSNHSGGSTGIQQLADTPYKVVQNPVQDQLILKAHSASPTVCSIYTMGGQMVQQHLLNATTETIDVSDLSSGLYILHMQHHNTSSSTRIIIQ